MIFKICIFWSTKLLLFLVLCFFFNFSNHITNNVQTCNMLNIHVLVLVENRSLSDYMWAPFYDFICDPEFPNLIDIFKCFVALQSIILKKKPNVILPEICWKIRKTFIFFHFLVIRLQTIWICVLHSIPLLPCVRQSVYCI